MDLEGPMSREDYKEALDIFKTVTASLSPEMRQQYQTKLDKLEANMLLASNLARPEDFMRLMGVESETISVKMCADDVDEVYYNGQDIRQTVSNISAGADGLKTFTFEAVPGGVLAIAVSGCGLIIERAWYGKRCDKRGWECCLCMHTCYLCLCAQACCSTPPAHKLLADSDGVCRRAAQASRRGARHPRPATVAVAGGH